jgi:hypothetical protein
LPEQRFKARAVDQRTGGILGRDTLAQNFADGLLREVPVHAVAAEQEDPTP